MRHVLGIDIGGTNFRIGMVGEDFRLASFAIVPSATIQGADAPDRLARAIRTHAEEARIAPAAVSIGFPSTLDATRRRLLSTPNVAGFSDIAIVDELEARLDAPVFINRDVNMLFAHDAHALNLPRQGVVIACYLGTGLGNVIAIDGKPLLGRNGVAAELGHIPVFGVQDYCTCGNLGCLETIGSGRYLAGLRDRRFPDTPIGELFLRHSDDEALITFLDAVAVGVATEISLLDPEYVVLGGGVLQMRGFPRKKLEERILFRARKPLPSGNVRLIYASDAQENGVIGAGIYGFEQLDARGRCPLDTRHGGDPPWNPRKGMEAI